MSITNVSMHALMDASATLQSLPLPHAICWCTGQFLGNTASWKLAFHNWKCLILTAVLFFILQKRLSEK